EELIGKPIKMLVPKSRHKQAAELLEICKAGTSVKNVEAIRLRPDGTEIPILLTLSLLSDEADNPLGIASIATDISKHVEIEQKLHEQNQTLEFTTKQLTESNQELKSFSYSVSHDLRSPLRAIEGFSGLLEEEYSAVLDEEGRRILKVIRDNTQRMDHLITDILQLSRLGQKKIKLERIDLNNLIRGIKAELMQGSPGRSIQWQIGELPLIKADMTLIKQAFTNIISNAIKFTGTREKARIEIGSKQEDGQLVLHVKDNGVGFDMQYVDKIFEVFQRLHPEDEFKGTGVGLAIARRVTHQLGGNIRAESEIDKGTTIFIGLQHEGETL
ncbi:MAG: PAS domain S-box protein, partial [Candidatus Marinimicrobia bacterium]|nr:PAS domain S-box protein [Candidatus Neomarinimicrobiota bacterium]